MTKIITTILVGIIVIAGVYALLKEPPFGSAINTEADLLTYIETLQADRTSDRYEQIKTTDKLIAGKEVRVDEYKTPKGEIGYQVIMKWSDANYKYTKAIGYGVDADVLTYLYKTEYPKATTTP